MRELFLENDGARIRSSESGKDSQRFLRRRPADYESAGRLNDFMSLHARFHGQLAQPAEFGVAFGP